MKSTIRKPYIKRCTNLFIFGLFVLFVDISYGDSLHSKIEKGRVLYDDQKYDEAIKSFIDAQIESPENPKLKYNVANTHYKMRNYEEAVKNYQDVAATAQDVQLEEQSIYNIGNCMYRQGKLEEAVEYYKKALELNPDDQDAKYNLEFVREEIKKRIDQAKQRENQQEQERTEKQEGEKEQESNDQKQQEQKRREEQKSEKEEKPNGQNQQPKGDQQQQQTQQQTPKEQQQAASRREKDQTKPISPEEAERWLRSLKEDKGKHRERQRERATGSLGTEKDW